jgi:HlyD family secretion protein
MTATITTTNKASAGRKTMPWWRSWPAIGGGAAVVLILGVWLIGGLFGGDGLDQDGPIYTARQGPLTIHVTESGTIQAREQVVIKSEVEGRTTIIWLIEEGKHVKEGDLLVELDVSELEDKLVEQQIRVQNTNASFIRSRESLEITRSKGESDIARAQLDYEFAIEDLTKYVEGEYPKLNNEMVAKIKLAQADLEDTENTYNWSVTLHEEKYISEADKTRDKLRLDRAKLDLDNAKADLKLLEEFTYKRRVRELESDVDQNEMALDRVTRQALANGVQDEADFKAKQSELNRQEEKLSKLKDQASKTKMYAPAAGMVIYATTGQDDRRGNDEPLEAGREVREREEIIHLPTAHSMLVNIKVHESSLKKVKVGQPVRVTINALPGKEFFGKVARIAPLPDAQSFWRGNPDLKVYNTEIHLDGELQGVRTGMTCKAQVIVQQLQDALFVPVQSVIRVAGKPTVYVKRRGKPMPVNVELGLDNKDYIHIVSGLAEGDRVLTNPPLDKVTGGQDPKQIAGDDADETKPEASAAPETKSPTADLAVVPNSQVDQAGQSPRGDGEHAGEGRGKPTAEQIAQMKEKMKNMTPEQRDAMRKQRQQRGQRRESSGGDQQK